MSREVIGDAPPLAASARPTASAVDTDAPASAGPGRPARHLGRVPAAVLVTVALIGAAMSGWVGYGHEYASAGSAPSRAVAAVVSGIVLDHEGPVRARLTISVRNAGAASVVVTSDPGAGSRTENAGSGEAGKPGTTSQVPLRLVPSSATIEPGTTAQFGADVRLDCGRGPWDQIGGLLMDVGDGWRPLPVVAASSTVVRLCVEGEFRNRPVTLASEQVRDGRLVLHLVGPSRQPIRIDAVRAGGVVLGRTGDVTMGPAGADLVLTHPPGCPEPWRTSGIPTLLLVDLRAGSPAMYPSSVRIDSSLLPQWILDSGCGTLDV